VKDNLKKMVQVEEEVNPVRVVVDVKECEKERIDKYLKNQ